MRGEVRTSSWRTPPLLWEKLKPLARQMRHQPTPEEEKLWGHLRNRQLLGFKFRRQHSIDRFIVDFYCPAAHLVIEVDGAIHDYTPQEDAIRQEFLSGQDMKVLRFSNEVINHDLNSVLQKISDCLR